MNVLVIGKGGREHALVRALKHSPSVVQVHVLPGNPGMAKEALCHQGSTSDFPAVLKLVKQASINLVIIGPEAEIADGLADALRAQDTQVFAPSKEAAQLESSKAYSKEFMLAAGVPTPEYQVVNSVAATMENAEKMGPPYVLKADGLAAGKGVFICETSEELRAAATALFEDNLLGSAGSTALLEKYYPGWELSFLILTDGEHYQPLPLSQDHKRLLDGDRGPNTGGMGVVGPLVIETSLEMAIHQRILEPTVRELKKRELLYRGVLYVGVMVTKDGPTVLEYNVRFGDPEAQVVLPLLDGDWGQVMMDVANGELKPLRWKPMHAACVVLAAENYPEAPVKGAKINGNPQEETASSYFLHAGTGRDEAGAWVTDGGRVLNAVGLGSSLKEAVANAYEQTGKASWSGAQTRRDIGQKVL